MVKEDGDEVLSGSAVVAGTGRDAWSPRSAPRTTRSSWPRRPAGSRWSTRRCATTSTASSRGSAILIIPVGLLLASSQFLRRDEGWQARDHQHRRRAGRHGARGAGAAHQRGLRRRRGAPRQQALPRAGAARDRGAGPCRRAVRRQDRHHHRRLAGARRGRAARRRRRGRRSTPRWPRSPNSTPTRTPRRRRCSNALHRRQPTWTVDRPGAVLVGAQVERDDASATTAAGCSARPRTCSTTAYDGRAAASRSRRTPHDGQRVLVLATTDGTFADGADATLPAGARRSRWCCSRTSCAPMPPPRCSTSPTRA